MTTIVYYVETGTSRYSITVEHRLIRDPIIMSVCTGSISSSFEKLSKVDITRRYRFIGCYHGSLEKGEYGMERLAEVEKSSRIDFTPGYRLAFVDNERKKILLSGGMRAIKKAIIRSRFELPAERPGRYTELRPIEEGRA